jgi:hypothetical protein
MTAAATTDDLHRLGYARSFTGFWLRPDGSSVLSESDALQEATRILYPEKESKPVSNPPRTAPVPGMPPKPSGPPPKMPTNPHPAVPPRQP